MNDIHALILGVIQGICEFFPISSSAHVKIAKHLLGIEQDSSVLFDLFCHLGTLTALVIALRKEILTVLIEAPKSFVLFFLALVPLVPFYFLLRPLRDFLGQDQYLGFCLIATGCILYLGQRLRFDKTESKLDAVWIGVSQATALIPGVSRSAATISCARVLGWDVQKAVRFSFLLSIPTIIGGSLIESIHLLRHESIAESLNIQSCAIGFATAAISGFFIVHFALKLLDKGNYIPFVWYCLGIGIFATVYLNLL